MEKKKVLFISQEIFPFLPKTDVSSQSRRLPQITQEEGKEIRVFTPRYSAINERRHQLHEVIRLSGLNLSIDDQDHPLIIKVASVSSAKMQVYFIDNDDYFKRNNNWREDDNSYYADNDERSMFFCRGVLETVKKLGWQPDVIHCSGWFSGIMALYVKHVYNKDPHFKLTKVIYNLYNDGIDQVWSTRFAEKLKKDGFPSKLTDNLKDSSLTNITKIIVDHCDGVSCAEEQLTPALQQIYEESSSHKMGFTSEEAMGKQLSAFIDKVVDEPVLV